MSGAIKFGDPIPMTESLTAGFYTGDVVNITAGTYTVLVFNGVRIIATGQLNWDGRTEMNQAMSIDELHSLSGLKPDIPLIVDTATRKAGKITQNISSTELRTVVTRL